MFCTKSNLLLTNAALEYIGLGYAVGATKQKALIDYFYPSMDKQSWDGISIVLDEMVCVDMDCFASLDKKYNLPETLKERSPRGLHFFYRLPRYFRGTSQVGWKKKIDILTKSVKPVSYGKKPNELHQGHVLCSPSKGYTRLYPKVIPAKQQLPIAPDWVLDALNK